MKKLTGLLLFSAIMALALLTGCENKLAVEVSEDIASQKEQTTASPDDYMVLGKQLSNPYTVSNMEKAFQNISRSAKSTGGVSVKTTHLYVRLLPKTEGQYRKITEWENVETYEYPLDYEIKKPGNKYFDKSVGNNPYTWLYVVVNKDFVLPKEIKYEILANLFLPYGDDSGVNTEMRDFLVELDREALKITDNSDEVSNASGKVLGFYPSGYITVWDDRKGQIPLQGAKVRARRWFTTRTTLTDANGYYFIDNNYSAPVNYSILWERDDFDVKDGGSVISPQAYYNGPKQESGWSLYIQSGMSLMYATIHRAAHRYYYQNTVLRTPRNGSFLSRLSIAAYDWESSPDLNTGGDALTSGFVKGWLNFPDIRIFKPSRGPRRIYSTTMHELAHAAHWAMDRSNYRNSDDVIVESWARAVQFFFTDIEYPGLFSNNTWIQSTDPSTTIYTPLFIDLMDNYNQRVIEFNNSLPDDDVNGYAIRDLEDNLIGSKTLQQTRDNLKSRYNNPTESNVDRLFQGYGVNP